MKYIYGTCDIPLSSIYSIYTPEKQAVYPYALLISFTGSSDKFSFRAFANEVYASTDGYGYFKVRYRCPYFYTRMGYSENYMENWEEPEEVSGSDLYSFNDNVLYIWANFNVINTDNGSIFFPKSPDPIPVSQLNPAELMQGFATMLSLRRMRGVKPSVPDVPVDETDAILEDRILYIKNASAVLQNGILEVY